MNADELKIGLKVRSKREFSGVPTGTIGIVVPKPNSWPGTNSVAVHWGRHPKDTLVDWFSLDELEFLEVVR